MHSRLKRVAPSSANSPEPAAAAADDVVVGERRAVVAVGIGEGVAHRDAPGTAGGAVGALGRDAAGDPHQARFEQYVGDEAAGGRGDRDAPVDFLVLDQLGTGGAHALHHEVEALVLGSAQAIVVNRGAQVLARAGVERDQAQCASARGQGYRRGARAVDDAHDARLATAVLEELLDGIGERRRLPQAAEVLLKLDEAPDRERLVHRTLQRAADERDDSGRHAFYRVIRAALLCELYAGRGAVCHSSASWDLARATLTHGVNSL